MSQTASLYQRKASLIKSRLMFFEHISDNSSVERLPEAYVLPTAPSAGPT